MMDLWTLPEELPLGNKKYKINADFRDILGVIHWLMEPDEKENVRLFVALKLFWEDFDQIPSEHHQEAADLMMAFIAGGKNEPQSGPPQPRVMDWDQDQAMIVADINKVAGCEIRALPFVHWWTFLAWFNGIGEGQLSTVVSIREKRRRGKKLDQWERDYYRQHKDVVDLKPRYTAEELEEQERLKKLLGE